MSKGSAVYVLSLALVAGLLGFAIVKPMVAPSHNGTVLREHFVETGDEWIAQWQIVNREGRETVYTIEANVDGQTFSDQVALAVDEQYNYAHHIYKAEVGPGEATFAIYRDGAQSPIEQVTHDLGTVP